MDDPLFNRRSSVTKKRLRASARRQFSHKPFGSVGVRSIAEEAETDPALIQRYFGSKLGLFNEILEGAFNMTGSPTATDPYGAEALTETVYAPIDQDLRKEFDPLLLLIMGAIDEETARMTADRFEAEFLGPLADRIGGQDRQYRAALAASLLLGFSVFRALLQTPSIAPGNASEEKALFHDLLEFIFRARPSATRPGETDA